MWLDDLQFRFLRGVSLHKLEKNIRENWNNDNFLWEEEVLVLLLAFLDNAMPTMKFIDAWNNEIPTIGWNKSQCYKEFFLLMPCITNR